MELAVDYTTKSDSSEKKPHFTKVYKPGWNRIKGLLEGDPTAARVWVFLVENAGHDNVLACSMAILEEELGLHRKTIYKKVKYLSEQGALAIAKMGTANVYILNPHETWKASEEFKNYHAITARALIGKAENKGFRKRLTHIVGQAEQVELFPVD
ncbi:hypothetical protein GGR16_000003 [Chelatococcus caeni]|uniref:Plasmid replication protein RepL domain-containing protein n=1 Tax=Chelatococcus caeni TaxID=1348468 RepID=A0A840BXH1_9HYPH|nr:replication/maintenance protein RepL [Chelatococcus caeni]MBB4014997.1 hypothetical protein [Chelatococcus caeni]